MQGGTMRIFDSIRGHFALLTGLRLTTVAGEASFTIDRVVSTEESPASDWIMHITITSSGKKAQIYVSDILNVYTGMINTYWDKSGTRWVTLAEMQKIIEKVSVSQAIASYVMALLATFDDIQSRKEPNSAIRYIPFREHYSLSNAGKLEKQLQ
jgi:hypothetical protein